MPKILKITNEIAAKFRRSYWAAIQNLAMIGDEDHNRDFYVIVRVTPSQPDEMALSQGVTAALATDAICIGVMMQETTICFHVSITRALLTPITYISDTRHG